MGAVPLCGVVEFRNSLKKKKQLKCDLSAVFSTRVFTYIPTRASFIDVISISTCKNDINFHLSTIDGGVGKLASTIYAHTLAVGSAQTFRTLSSEVL